MRLLQYLNNWISVSSWLLELVYNHICFVHWLHCCTVVLLYTCTVSGASRFTGLLLYNPMSLCRPTVKRFAAVCYTCLEHAYFVVSCDIYRMPRFILAELLNNYSTDYIGLICQYTGSFRTVFCTITLFQFNCIYFRNLSEIFKILHSRQVC